MLDFETVLEMMRKYDFSSTTAHPYIYLNGDNVGVCYSYYDENYGFLERVKFFDNVEILEDFLKKLSWFNKNGKKNNVRIMLDDYQIVNPKVIFLRNEKVMVKGEMFDIDGFELRKKQNAQLDEISRAVLEAGDLLMVYEDIKNRQSEYLNSVNKLANELRIKYFDLQKEVDKYNGIILEKEMTHLPDYVSNDAVNEMMEKSAKDRFHVYKTNHPSLEEAKAFVKEVWELNMGLELNNKYYEAQAQENNIRNEIRVVNEKISFMKKLNDSENKTVFKVNLIKEFKRINRTCEESSVLLSNDYVKNKIRSVQSKYSYFNIVDFFGLAEFLKECIHNTNYPEVALKYTSNLGNNYSGVSKPLNEMATDLFVQYRDKLTIEEQAIVVLYNSKYRNLFDLIMGIPKFQDKPMAEIISVLNKTKGFSKIKSQCYDFVKNRLSDPINAEIKNKVFININFDSFEVFIESIVNQLKKLKAMDNKIMLTTDLNMYFYVKDINEINNKYFISLTNDLNSLKKELVGKNDMIAITSLKYGTPVIYSPYYLDFGNVYSKKSQVKMEIKEMSKFELLIDVDDIVITINNDDNYSSVVDYVSKRRVEGNITVAEEINSTAQLRFCRLALVNGISSKNQKN